MRQFKFGSALLMTMILVGCGGGGSDVPAKPKFSAQVSFGDSLSDVGSYQPGLIGSLGGGQFTINAASSVKAFTPTNWTEMTSVKLGIAGGFPCAAVTGGFGAASSVHAGCYGYGEGGARITSASGVGNVGVSGPMTLPVVTQIATHLGAHGGFSNSDIVYVMAGANDVFTQAGMVSANLITPASAVQAIQTAATQLATQINTNIIGKGASHVVVINVPDIASTPQVTSIASAVVQAQTAGLIDTLVTTFNAVLKAGVPDSATVLNVDAYTASKDEVANPGKYLLTNVATTACNLNYGFNALANSAVPDSGSSLVCNANNLNAGVLPTAHYLFADKIHPTPYGHLLFATYVLQAMTNKGWY
jgi:outer membrane lipase/esterase